MPNFSYTAISSSGKNLKGMIEATDIAQATSAIKNEGNTIVSISESGKINQSLNITLFEKKPKPRELAIFCRQFVSITTAGVPVISAFEMLAEQTENGILRKAIEECCLSIRQGMSLSEAMSEHPKVFNSLLITMVAAGEATGNLEVSFTRMATQFEKDAKLKALIVRSAAYPSVVLVIAVVVVIVLLGFVVPNFEELLLDLGTDMPAFSVAVIGAGKFMQANWVIVVIAIAAIVGGLISYSRTKSGKNVFSNIQLMLPLFKTLAVKTASARACRTLATLVSAGVPLIDAIEISANTMSNMRYKECLLSAKDEVAMGMPLSEPLFRANLFPKMVCHMMKIGEESGDLEGMLTKLADYYDEEVENTTATVMAALEPMIIVFLAGIIITIVMGVMLPMTAIYDGLDNL